MKERPIIFSGESVRAILAETKTQTRRVVKPQPPGPPTSALRHPARHPGPYFDSYCSEPKTLENPRGMSDLWCWWTADDRCDPETRRCPYGVPGDRLWVREAFSHGSILNADVDYETRLRFRANGHDSPLPSGQKWRSPLFMRRALSRLTLEVTDVRVQRLQEISEEDAQAEGVARVACTHPDCYPGSCASSRYRPAFALAWDALNGKRAPWGSNPWVWAITFRRLS